MSDEGKKPEKAQEKKQEKRPEQAQKAKGSAPAKAKKEISAPIKRTAPPRMLQKYRSDVVPALMAEFSHKNPMQVPRLKKIVVNMGMGEALQNPKILDAAFEELGVITGQRPVITRARKSIANFKLRQGVKIGAVVTLRREKMWEFFDRLVSLALPRTRDFRGVPAKSFDGRGSYTLGLKEQTIFPEISYDKVEKVKGMNITVVTSARNDDEARALLRHLGMPFRI